MCVERGGKGGKEGGRDRQTRTDLKVALWFVHFLVMPKRGGGNCLEEINLR